MRTSSTKWTLCWCCLLHAAGCSAALPDTTQTAVCESTEGQSQSLQALPEGVGTTAVTTDSRKATTDLPPTIVPTAATMAATVTLAPPLAPPVELLHPTAVANATPKLLPVQIAPAPPSGAAEPRVRLEIPIGLPGAQVPPLDLPSPGTVTKKERDEALRRLFPERTPLERDAQPLPGPNGNPLTLTELQQLALVNNPIIRQAAAAVQIAHGRATQAGLWPNPIAGFEGDQIHTANTAGYLGVFIAQTIKTAGKPGLARASALIDVLNAELAQHRAEADLVSRVRSGYFAVLVARENLKVSHALAEFADEVYRLQVDLLKAAQSPAYESLQLRVLSTQARAGLLQARNRYSTAWKQLTNDLGLPAMPPTALAGEADMLPPQYDYYVVLQRVLRTHTDVAVALNAVQKAQIDLKLALVMPIPDVNVGVAVQHDYTVAPFGTTANIHVGLPIPVWDRNQGAIQAAEWALIHAQEESARVGTELTARVAEAFERYDNNRRILTDYRTSILPDQVRAYRALYRRHRHEPNQVNLQDVVNAQQLLAQSVTTFLVTLNAQWTAVVDLSNLLQTNELFGDTGPACDKVN